MAPFTRSARERERATLHYLLSRVKSSPPLLAHRRGRIRPEDRCRLAESNLEARLYISNRQNVYAFYRKLPPGGSKEQADREARFNRMFDAVSEGRARTFLLAHGCAPW